MSIQAFFNWREWKSYLLILILLILLMLITIYFSDLKMKSIQQELPKMGVVIITKNIVK